MQDESPALSKLQAWGILVFLSLIWGTSYILIKKALISFSPLEVGSIRLTVAAIAFTPFLAKHLKLVKKEQWWTLFLVGLSGTGLPSILFPLAQEYVNSSLAGILNSVTPLFTLILGLLFFQKAFSKNKTAGIIIGLLGAICLFAFGEEADMGEHIGYGFYIILACLCYALSANLVADRMKGLNAITISVVSFTMIGVPAACYLFLATPFMQTLQVEPEAWSSFGYIVLLAIFSTVLAGIIFFKLIQITGAVFGSTVSYIVPIVAMLWGVLDGEVITWIHLLGMALILVGVYLSKGK